ncbi:MAG: hypothetical protein E7614_07935 [Ruminococcaceae bacterium]|nr:hypothetical protein [Oscillospiraceae bacterium]
MKRTKRFAAIITVAVMLFTSIFSAPALEASAAGTETPFYLWKQYDEQWKDVYIGNNTIGNIGCYVTSAAMLIVYGGLRTEADFDPATLVYELKSVGGFSGNLIYKGKINKAVPGFDYRSEVLLGKTKAEKTEAIQYYLNKGYYIIAGVKNLGHYVAIREVKNGVVYMMDPASEYNVLFDYYSVSGVTKIFLYTSTGKKVNIGDVSDNVSGTTPPSEYVPGIYKTTDRLNLRESASTTSAAITIIPADTEITVTTTSGVWGKTSFEGFEGYVCLDYANLISEYKDPSELSSEEPSSEESSSEDPSSEEPSSEEPSSEEPSSEEPSSEEPSSEEPSSEEPSSEEPSSEEPSSEEPSSEEPSSEESSSEEPYDYVSGTYKTTGSIYLREQPTTSSSILTVIPSGTEIVVTETSGIWGKTSYDGFDGYCGLKYTILLNPTEEPPVEPPVQETPVSIITDGENRFTVLPSTDTYNKGYYEVTSNLRLRADATTSSASLAIMSAGTKIQITEIKDGWGKTVYNQLTGWCSLEYCRFDSPYLIDTTISSEGIVGILGKEADLSSLSINFNYSDGSVYSVKGGIQISYTIPTSAKAIDATAKYEGKSYSFKILYLKNCTVKLQENVTYVIVGINETAESVFGDSNIEIITDKLHNIDGITFKTIKAGDVDCNGSISTTDYLRIKQAFLGNHTFTNATEIAADVNGDGSINATDYLLIKNKFIS